MDSMEELYRRHARLVYAFLMSKTKNPDIAEELTQETFYQALRSIDQFKGESTASTWLCGIAKNVWYRSLRKIRDEVSLNESTEGFIRSAEEAVLCDWDKLEVIRQLHKLQEPMREVLYLRLIANLSFREIGEIMAKTENWARVTYYRGKEKIIEEVKKHE